jgi:hypothetical protein
LVCMETFRKDSLAWEAFAGEWCALFTLPPTLRYGDSNSIYNTEAQRSLITPVNGIK